MKIHTKKLKKMFVLDNVISDEDYRMMLDYARETGREKYYYIMKVLAGTGIRVGELRYITVENVKRGRGVVYNKGKYREIFISSGLQNILMEYCQQRSICLLYTSFALGNRKTTLLCIRIMKRRFLSDTIRQENRDKRQVVIL